MSDFFVGFERSKYKLGYDMKYQEEATKLLMEKVQELHLQGYASSTIAHALVYEMGFKLKYAYPFVAVSVKQMQEDVKDREKTMKFKNLARLEHIYAICLQTGDIPNAIKAVTELNKMCNLYTNNIELTQHNFQFNLGSETTTVIEQLPEIIDTNLPINESN